MNKDYYAVRKKYLANALAYLGYRYYRLDNGKDIVYSFKDTKEFREALTGLMQLKKEVGQYLD